MLKEVARMHELQRARRHKGVLRLTAPLPRLSCWPVIASVIAVTSSTPTSFDAYRTGFFAYLVENGIEASVDEDVLMAACTTALSYSELAHNVMEEPVLPTSVEPPQNPYAERAWGTVLRPVRSGSDFHRRG